MRKLCPNLDREDGLDTVLEVPIPEEMFASDSSSTRGGSNKSGCTNMMPWVRSQHRYQPSVDFDREAKLQLMLGVIGAPLVPFSIRTRDSIFSRNIKNGPIETSMAKYIVQQYIAAAGGEKALNSISSMYAMGKVRMTDAESNGSMNINKKPTKGGGEVGGFVLWQKKPDLWCLELVVSGCKLIAGSDGKVAWRQAPGQHSHASRGPPRPLRRILQGLDPRSTANLFSDAVCIGEEATVHGGDCFVLRLDAELSSLRSRSTKRMEIMRHTVRGYFSQRTGLLVQLEDSHLIKIRGANEERVYWETNTETSIEDYRTVDGVNISHRGCTSVSLSRFGESVDGNMKTRMEETWAVEEVDFNIQGLSMECFLAPGDLNEEKQGCKVEATSNVYPPIRLLQAGVTKLASSKVAAVNIDDTDTTQEREGKI